MARMKKRIFAGDTCDQIVYCVGDRAADKTAAKPRVRFKTEQEREEHRRGIARRRHVRLINANADPSWYFGTLTFDSEHECHEFEEAVRERDNFYKRVKRACPEAVLFLYLGRGKTTSRIHMHIICGRVDAETITGKWTCGTVKRMEHLREHVRSATGEDLGRDYTAVANYCFDHWTQEQSGKHYYKCSRNLGQPEEEEPTECKREYGPERPPRPPKGFRLAGIVWNKYGYICFHYVRERVKKAAGREPQKSLVDV